MSALSARRVVLLFCAGAEAEEMGAEKAMASNLLAMASNLSAMASNLGAIEPVVVTGLVQNPSSFFNMGSITDASLGGSALWCFNHLLDCAKQPGHLQLHVAAHLPKQHIVQQHTKQFVC